MLSMRWLCRLVRGRFLLSCLHTATGHFNERRGIEYHESDGGTSLGCPSSAVFQDKTVAVSNGGCFVGTGTLKRDITSLVIGCQSADSRDSVCSRTSIRNCVPVISGFNGELCCTCRVGSCRSTDNVTRILVILVNACTCEGISDVTPVLVILGLEGGEYHRTIIIAENVPLCIAHFFERMMNFPPACCSMKSSSWSRIPPIMATKVFVPLVVISPFSPVEE